MKHIHYCKTCDTYTMKELCVCGRKALMTRPGRYSPGFKHKKLRRDAKKNANQ